jgi:hypothetical protein
MPLNRNLIALSPLSKVKASASQAQEEISKAGNKKSIATGGPAKR